MMSDSDIEAVLERALPLKSMLIEAAFEGDALWRTTYRLAGISTHEALFLRNYIDETYAKPSNSTDRASQK